MKNEHKLILQSVLVDKTENENNQIDNILSRNIDWIETVGVLMNHRLAGYFYKGLSKEQLSKVPKELRKNLLMLVNGQVGNQEKLNYYINELSETLENNELRYAGIKGIIYGASIYAKGTRRSNDLDLLVFEEDLGKLDTLMRKVGYIQTSMQNGKFEEASKKEKMIQRMNYHDLVPYMKQIEDGFIEVDINFLFDEKDNLVDSEVFDKGTIIYENEQYSFRGLKVETNLAYLICHFYREATGDIWVNSKRNLVLYKIVDIVNFIRHYESQLIVEKVVELFEELNILEKAIYSFFTIEKFYGEQNFIKSCIECMEKKYPDICDKYKNNDIFDKYLEDSFNLGR